MNNTLTTSQARSNFYQLVKQTNETHVPINIIGKNNNAVLVAEEDWENIQETLHLYSIAGMQKSIEDGINTPIEDCSKNLDW